MSKTTAIEWCDSTFNPWIGCTRVSPACDDCYAARSTPARTLGVVWGPSAERRRTNAENWKHPLRWNAKPFYECEGCGWRGEDDSESSRLRICMSCGTRLARARRRVFCASLADVFDNEVPVQWRRDLFDLIEATPHLDWLLLTKRIGNASRLYANAYLDSARPWPGNVWLGATICNQTEADRDIPKLLATPAAKRFLSIEPMLGPITLREVHSDICEIDALTCNHGVLRPLRGRSDAKVHWVICGGESGPRARPMHPDWARSLRDQCAAAGVPFLFKQWGEWLPAKEGRSITGHVLVLEGHAPLTDKPQWHGFEDGQQVARVGKRAAGRLLDGRTHDGFPGAAA